MSKRILVIEDELIVSRDLQMLLLRLGHSPIGAATNGPDAIRIAAEQRPDLILMDIRLDGPMDGVEAAQEIVRNQTVPIIFITAYSDAFICGATTIPPHLCIGKPFSRDLVKAAIECVDY